MPATHESGCKAAAFGISRAVESMSGCALGFDYGTRRIGVAAGNRITASAHALHALAAHAGEPDWNRVDALLAEWKPDALVVGLPLMLDGSDQAITRAARAFAESLRERYDLPVHLIDERHTSQQAARDFAVQRAAGLKRQRDAANLDSRAAAIILESWLQENVSG